MVSRSALLPALSLPALASASLFLWSGCGGADDTSARSGPPMATKTTTTTSTSATGFGGKGGGGGGGAGATGGGGQAAGGGGAGGANGGGGAGGSGGAGGDTGPLPADSPCNQSQGFYGGGMAFTFPTPPKLAAVLNALTYDVSARPISLALLSGKQPGKALLAVSATIEGPNGATFLPGKEAPFSLVSLQYGGFTTIDPSPKGWLRVIDETQNPIDLELANIYVSVSTQAACTRLVGTLDALIPASVITTTLTHDGQTHSLAELAPSEKPDQPIQIHALFTGESMNFDFSSL